jgi:hypothetical protein
MLRKAVSILLIVLLSAQSLYKLGLVTYFEINREYIATVLCINKKEPAKHCNGQCYLKKNLKKADSKENTPVNTIREKIELQACVVEDFIFDLDVTIDSSEKNTPYLNVKTIAYHRGQYRPPSVS